MRPNEWTSFVSLTDMDPNGIYVCQPCDAVLDEEDWPIWSITMRNGFVVGQTLLYKGHSYAMDDMMGWDLKRLHEWVNYEGNDPQQQNNSIILLGKSRSDYWFCVDLTCTPHMQFALDVMSYYHVRGYVVGDGDSAEYLVVDEETRPGALQLAEMCFSAPGRWVWHQEKVCPICKDNGEEICGHMYFTDAHEAAF